jgi:hypothetical protein
MPTFKDLVDTIYSDVFAYTTVKVVRTKDWRLSAMKRMFNIGGVIYVLFFVVFNHGYLYKEVPVVTVSTSVTGDSMALQLLNLSFVYSNGGYPPTYCAALRTNSSNASASYSTTVTDYVYDLTRLYVNNECAQYFTPPELTEKVYMGVWLYTYWQQSNYVRACSPNNYTGTSLAGANSIPTPSALAGNPSNVPNCGSAQLLLNQSVIPVAAEFITLTLAGTYVTSWGATKTRVNTTIMGPAPTSGNGTAPSMNFPPTSAIQITFAQLLALAGLDLDTQNVIQDGGWGPGNWPPGQTVPGYPSYVPTWPTWRISGVELIMEMKYHNFVETLLPPDPFNLDDYLVATLRVASNGTFRGPGTKLWYLGADISQPETQFMVRTPQGVLLTFLPSGSIGTFSFGSLLSTLVGAIVLFGAATALIDISAAFLIEGFREQKFEDELELRIRAMLRTQLADVPTRAEIDEYEQEALMKQLQAEAKAARKRARYDRMRARAQRSIPKAAREAAAAAAGVTGKPGLPLLPAAPAGGEEAGGGGGGEEDEGYTPVTRTPEAPLTGTAQSLTPRVVRLLINGEPFHGSSFTAQGFLENCRCVRFQWFKSRDGVHFVEVPGATMPTFFANADDVGHLLAVDATPVTDDGFEGAPKRAYTAALCTRPFILGKVHSMVGVAKGGFKEIRDGVWVSGVRSTLTLRRSVVEARTKKSISLGSVDLPGVDVSLSRDDPRAMTVTGLDGMVFDVTFHTPEEREMVALAIRELAGASIELLNDPAYHPKVPPPDSDEEEEE